MPPSRIGILLGSQRPQGNNVGLLTWLTSIVTPLLPSTTSLTVLDYSALGRVEGPIVPELVASSEDYPDEATRRWSRDVAGCDAFIVLTPQFNWSVPGRLKESLDHLKREWATKPVLIVAYGGKRAGSKVREHLNLVLGGALDMKVVGDVGVPMPMEFIAGERRIKEGGRDETGEVLEFLKEPEEEVKRFVGELIKA
ncbi:NAD(P)H-dependent FMN reductase [Pseudohyphozyma bogoriensis]|nr:NAD(P)H-dependent FMN reductase [Pseudohyphozyma bogoriensis]